jgi:hypothetical protein
MPVGNSQTEAALHSPPHPDSNLAVFFCQGSFSLPIKSRMLYRLSAAFAPIRVLVARRVGRRADQALELKRRTSCRFSSATTMSIKPSRR